MIWQTLSNFSNKTILIITKMGALSVKDISNYRVEYFKNNTLSDDATPLAGKRFLIATESARNALKVICVLDGIADAIGFASPTLSDDALKKIAHKGKFDIVIWDEIRSQVTDDGILFCHSLLAAIPHCKNGATSSDSNKINMPSRWVMTTSGTTGEPKLVSHSFNSLTKTAKGIGAARPDVIWGMLYDYTRFAGMQVFLQSCLSGSTLVVPDRSLPLAEQVAYLSKNNANHFSGTPTLWRKVLMLPESKTLKPKHITLGGEIVNQAILNGLESQYSDCRIIHIYASTEAGVGFSVSDKKAGFPKKYISEDKIIDGIKLKVSDDGILHIENRAVKTKYVGDERMISDTEGWIETGDMLRLDGERYFFLGRESGLINVGGNKVLPEKIEEILLMHPAVIAARAYAKKSPITGELVAAEIVISETAKGTEREIKRDVKNFSAERLEKFETPAFIKGVDSIELNESGKVKRH